MRVSRTFSFDSEDDVDILVFLDTLPNASAYIRELIRYDRGWIEGDSLPERIIRQLLTKYVGNVAPVMQEKKPAVSALNNNDLENIASILNM